MSPMALIFVILWIAALFVLPASVVASPEIIVFYPDKLGRPTVTLNRVPELPPVRAILALYALENGAGCEGKNRDGLVNCKLTRELGLGANCSPEHIGLVREWFETTPKLTTRWNSSRGNTKQSGSLESLCYGQPDTASWLNLWEYIRLRIEADLVHVYAILFWGSRYGTGSKLLEHTYRIEADRVVELSSKETELRRSPKGLYE